MRWPFALTLICAALALLALPRVSEAAVTIGETTVVVRDVTGLLEQNLRSLDLEDQVYFKEVIESGEDSATEIRFADGTTLTIGPNTRITLDSVVYDPDPSKSEFIVSITNGVLRLATGTLASESYKVKTPVATVGVRGTVLNTASAETDVLLQSILTEMGAEEFRDRATAGTVVWTDEGEARVVQNCRAEDIWAVNLGFEDSDEGASFANTTDVTIEFSDGTVLSLGANDLEGVNNQEEFLEVAKAAFQQVPGIIVTQVGKEIQVEDARRADRDFNMSRTSITGGVVKPLRLTDAEGGLAFWQGAGTATLVLQTDDCPSPIVGDVPPTARELADQTNELIISALANVLEPGAGEEEEEELLDNVLLENPSQVSPE